MGTANVTVAADEDGEAMRRLVEAMQPGVRYTFKEIVELCRANECFDGLVGEPEADMKIASRATLARLLARYDDRRVKDRKFVIEGKSHKRRFHVEAIETDAC